MMGHRGSITLSKGYRKFEALMQEWGGGDGIKVVWKKGIPYRVSIRKGLSITSDLLVNVDRIIFA